jgi:hypothetical protein
VSWARGPATSKMFLDLFLQFASAQHRPEPYRGEMVVRQPYSLPTSECGFDFPEPPPSRVIALSGGEVGLLSLGPTLPLSPAALSFARD